jgi:hypothetical protein
MRIKVRGWGRDVGETQIMSAALEDAEKGPTNRYSKGKTYLRVDHPEVPFLTKVRVSTSAELRLGGSYLLQVELSRREIAQLFYETHGGDIVKMFKSFVEDEDRKWDAHEQEQLAQYRERLQQRLAQDEQAG